MFLTARYTVRCQHYNEAAASFRTAFVETIYGLRKGSDDVYKVITAAAIADQERALIRFKPFLTSFEIIELNAAWDTYVKGRHTIAPGSLDNRRGEIAKAQSHIDALWKCSKPK